MNRIPLKKIEREHKPDPVCWTQRQIAFPLPVGALYESKHYKRQIRFPRDTPSPTSIDYVLG